LLDRRKDRIDFLDALICSASPSGRRKPARSLRAKVRELRSQVEDWRRVTRTMCSLAIALRPELSSTDCVGAQKRQSKRSGKNQNRSATTAMARMPKPITAIATGSKLRSLNTANSQS
jgi:hypothetical protein